MTPRDAFVLALRIIGAYGVMQTLAALPYSLLALPGILSGLAGTGSAVGAANQLLTIYGSGGGALVVDAALSLVLLFLAPRIAGIFYAEQAPAEAVQVRAIEAGDLCRLGTVLLGLYVLVQAVPGIVRMAGWLLASNSLGTQPYMAQDTMTQIVSAAVYLVIGLALILFSRQIAAWAMRDAHPR